MNTRHSTEKTLSASLLAVALFTFVGFCILTNSAGDYRKYLDTDIPFVYRLNDTTPLDYFASIVAGHMQWNNVPSAYWEFSQGPLTSASDAVQDGINLVFFDVPGVNFPPPTNVIAFSRTFTSNAGGYHALESDLVWNARDFPPSPTGAAGQQDLQGVIAHEFGHHLGLGHQGSPGGPPGCGPLIPQAVMYGLSASGDTTNRNLHIHDIGGVSAIYPVWILQGTVTDAGTAQPIASAQVKYVGSNVVSIGAVEDPGTFERPGLVFDTEATGPNGFYGDIVLDQTFDLIVDPFGYIPDTATISFNPPGGIGQTQTIVHNVASQIAPMANITGVVRDANTLSAISATIEFFGVGDTAGLTLSVQTQPNGSYTANLSSTELYNITVIPSSPYVDHVELDSVLLPPSGATVDFDLLEAQVLLVDDDAGDPYEARYQGSLDRLNIRRRTFSVADSAATPVGVLATFTEKPVLLWFTGNDTTDALDADERLVIIDHLTAGGDAIITGQDIAEFSAPGDSLIAKYLGIQQNGNYLTGALIVRGFPGDIIGDGITFQLVGGAGNQTSKDILSIIGGSVGTPTKTLYYGVAAEDTVKIAAVRVLGPGAFWGVSYFGFGLEVFTEARMDTMILRSMRYFDVVVSVTEPSAGTVPGEFSLAQNYPNPFNPTTQIQYGLPQQSRVSIIVYDVNGRVVTKLFQGDQEAGLHIVHWNGKNNQGYPVSTGIYFYELKALGTDGYSFVQTRKMLMLK